MKELLSQLSDYKDFLTAKDLINMGLFRSYDAAYFARLKGNSPSYVVVGRRILYPKKKILEFIQTNLQDGSIAKLTTKSKEN